MKSEFKKIPLTRGMLAIVDAEDFEFLNQWKWYAQKGRNNNFYAARASYDSNRQFIFMHILIGKPSKGSEVDHKNGDTLDNRKDNLRNCSRSQNAWNSGLRKDNTSGFKGVTFHKQTNSWMSRIVFNQKTIYLGLFDSKIKAARAYNKAAIQYFGEFARLNPV